jgi:hypothetical protein
MRMTMGGALLMVALSGASCRTMKPVTLDQLSGINTDRVWITKPDSSVVILYVPQVLGDTLVGYVNGEEKHLPSTALKRVTVMRPAPARTALLVGGLAVGVAGMLSALSGSGEYKMPTAISGAPGDCDKHPEDPICQGHP